MILNTQLCQLAPQLKAESTENSLALGQFLALSDQNFSGSIPRPKTSGP